MASSEQTTLTRREAAELLDTSERNLRRLIELGRIPVHAGPKGSRLLLREDILRYRSRTSDAVTQEHAAQVLDVDVRTVRRMLKDGRLAPIEMESGRLRVARTSLDALALSYALPEDETGHEDGTGHSSDETGHDGFEPDMTGHAEPDVPRSRPDIADDLVPIAGLAPLDAPAPAAAQRMPRRRPVAAALIGLAVAAAATFAVAATRGDDTAKVDATGLPQAAVAASPTTIPTASTSDATTSAAVAPPAKATPPKKTTKARGGATKPVSDPVRRKKKRRPKPAATAPATNAQADATPPPSDPTPEPTPTPDPPANDPATAGDPVCEDVYGLEGLC